MFTTTNSLGANSLLVRAASPYTGVRRMSTDFVPTTRCHETPISTSSILAIIVSLPLLSKTQPRPSDSFRYRIPSCSAIRSMRTQCPGWMTSPVFLSSSSALTLRMPTGVWVMLTNAQNDVSPRSERDANELKVLRLVSLAILSVVAPSLMPCFLFHSSTNAMLLSLACCVCKSSAIHWTWPLKYDCGAAPFIVFTSFFSSSSAKGAMQGGSGKYSSSRSGSSPSKSATCPDCRPVLADRLVLCFCEAAAGPWGAA
mmetsp:Transcript_58712/g.179083  ORF Transcript_58712/g.179083 Transcript_58712/m.179083 type:complete len:256 (+) Transcript_58712:628-1395(+)